MANNRLPFGLCKEYGIQLPDGATPKDAWYALKKHGAVDKNGNVVHRSNTDYDKISRVDRLITDKGGKANEKKRSAIRLSKQEYAHVMSELATNMSKEQRSQKFVKKPIGDYVYVVENNGFGDYRIIDRFLIDDE